MSDDEPSKRKCSLSEDEDSSSLQPTKRRSRNPKRSIKSESSKHKRRKRSSSRRQSHSDEESLSDESSTGDASTSCEKYQRKKDRHRKSKKRKTKKSFKKDTKKHKRKSHTSTDSSDSDPERVHDHDPTSQHEQQYTRPKEISKNFEKKKEEQPTGPTSNIDSATPKDPEREGRRTRMIPMSREQYEKEQSVIREVYDEDSGRWRLVRGSGEIIERIVSRQDHQRINQRATQGDGSSFTKHIYGALPKK